ncbi:MAG: NADH-quinone oxidoreductase subunit J [Actinomycetota bacterium]
MGSVLAAAHAGGGGTAEAVVFWILAPIALIAALAMVTSRNAVHAALFLIADFFCLAVMYLLLDAQFLFAVQIIVYTGAIMVLFLFVLMLVGVDRSDSLVETLRGQRPAAVLLGLAFAALLGAGVGPAIWDLPSRGVAEANGNGGNVLGIARLLFTDYVFAFEVTSALLIVAAVGAMVLAHKERTGPRRTQRELSMRRFAGGHVTPEPGPGVYATADDANEPVAVATDSRDSGSYNMGDE